MTPIGLDSSCTHCVVGDVERLWGADVMGRYHYGALTLLMLRGCGVLTLVMLRSCGALTLMRASRCRLDTLSRMRAADELTDEQVRQLLFDLDSAYSAFNRLLHQA